MRALFSGVDVFNLLLDSAFIILYRAALLACRKGVYFSRTPIPDGSDLFLRIVVLV